jgi:hypothetical protein
LSAALAVEVAPPVVTSTSTAPAVVAAGLVAVQVVTELQLTFVAASVPKSTVSDVVENPVPVMVTGVSPARGPEVGLMAVTVGPAPAAVYVN